MKDQTHPDNIRLALRVEGDKWTAYAAPLNTMEGAVWLVSIHMGCVGVRSRKEEFMQLMQGVLSDYIKERTGAAPHWNKPKPAPEHERAGRA